MCSFSPGGSSSPRRWVGKSRLAGYPGPHRCRWGKGPARKERSHCPNTAMAASSGGANVSAFPPSPEEGGKERQGEKKLNIKCREFLPLASNFLLIYVESMVPCSHMDGRLPAIISVNRFVSSIFSCSILLLGNVHISMAYT